MNIRLIKNLIKYFESSSLNKLEIKSNELEINMEKNQQINTPETNLPSQTQIDENHHTVHSPLVGTYYSAPSSSSKPFVTVGEKVKAGQPLCLIEALKTFNEINSPVSGTIVEILVSNQEVVEYNQPLIRIDAS
jgi:acetyl-CoA carboxylase biotin carboxyl carrier protein